MCTDSIVCYVHVRILVPSLVHCSSRWELPFLCWRKQLSQRRYLGDMKGCTWLPLALLRSTVQKQCPVVIQPYLCVASPLGHSVISGAIKQLYAVRPGLETSVKVLKLVNVWDDVWCGTIRPLLLATGTHISVSLTWISHSLFPVHSPVVSSIDSYHCKVCCFCSEQTTFFAYSF